MFTVVTFKWYVLHLQCQEQQSRVDETLFPHTYNPNMSLVSVAFRYIALYLDLTNKYTVRGMCYVQ